jgi:hypothetical protein
MPNRPDPMTLTAADLVDLPPGDYRATVDEFRLGLDATADGPVAVAQTQASQAVMVGTREDVARLAELLVSERDRAAAEIVDDARAGALGADPAGIRGFEDLGGVVDSNVYVAGGRTGSEPRGDEKKGWSDIAAGERTASLLAHGLIGKGTGEAIDPDDLGGSESFAGFDNAVGAAVAQWLERGGLGEALHGDPDAGSGYGAN